MRGLLAALLTTSFFACEPAWALDYGGTEPPLRTLGVPALHDAGFTGEGVVIAVLDTGFDLTSAPFARLVEGDRILATRDFVQGDDDVVDDAEDPADQDDHGTSILSLLAGYEEGVHVGVAPDATYILAKTEELDVESRREEWLWADAAAWAADLGADVLISALNWPELYPASRLDGTHSHGAVRAAELVEQGVHVVISMGNGGPRDGSIQAPADGLGVLAVGATDAAVGADVYRFSGRGPTADGRTKPDVLGPGFAQVVDPAGFDTAAGTSVAVALVGGLVALLHQRCPGLDPGALRDLLRDSAHQADRPDNDAGWGVPAATVALAALEGVDCAPAEGDDDDAVEYDDDDAMPSFPDTPGRCAASVSTKAAPEGAALLSVLMVLLARRTRSRKGPQGPRSGAKRSGVSREVERGPRRETVERSECGLSRGVPQVPVSSIPSSLK